MGDQPDHPRSRGVYRFDSLCASAKSGSSPLARGLQEDHGVVALLHRIIPARAGFTSTCRARRARSPDHPRSRGVYPPSGVMASSGQGSSPLARGLPSRLAGRIGSRGIIPARAGFTDAALLAHHVTPDHPRSRGVYWPNALDAAGIIGSSPLARGLHRLASLLLARMGIIPARAGFTERKITSGLGGADHPRSRGVYTCGSLESQRRATLPDRVCLHCRPSARSAELR